MADIEVVIKIPEEVYKYVQQIGSVNMLDTQQVANAILDGTQIPKGHGDLIDSQELIEKWDNLSVRGRTEFDQVIMCMSPIIEADKE